MTLSVLSLQFILSATGSHERLVYRLRNVKSKKLYTIDDGVTVCYFKCSVHYLAGHLLKKDNKKWG